METEVIIRNERTTPALTDGQFSITTIPGMVYDHFFELHGIGEEKTFCYGEQLTKYRELRVGGIKKERVFMLHSKETSGDAVEEKFALLTWEPNRPHYHESYEFQINGKLSSGTWVYGEGNIFREGLTFETANGEQLINHPMTHYAALALNKALGIAQDQNAVSQRFIDHSPHAAR